MSAELKRKHLKDGTYFVWRCEHKNGQCDRASDRNDGPQQDECPVELVAEPNYAHCRVVAQIELAQAMGEFHSAVNRVEEQLLAILRELRTSK